MSESNGGMATSGGVLPGDAEVGRSIRYCHGVTRRHARNFYYGLKLTPEPKRSAVYAIYAFMRACDDLVDAPVGEGQTRLSGSALTRESLLRVQGFRRQMQSVIDGGPLPDDPAERSIWPAFAWVMRRFPVQPQHLHDMLDGQQCDLMHHRYATFEQLYDYCYKVASVVGLTCVRIWGCADGEHQGEINKLAEYRGIAFQLTNILRDVVEDARRGRVYLPADELARFGYDPADLVDGHADAAFDRLMQFQIERARSYYEMSSMLDKHLSPDCRDASWTLVRIYSQLLEKIAANPRKVLTSRVRLGSLQKATIALRAAWRRRSV